jgi:glycosyltransferase involved in cell wall biosynthesis
MNPAIFYSPDAYALPNNQIMGRRSVSSAFLRAAVEGRNGDPMIGYLHPSRQSEFTKLIGEIDPSAKVHCVTTGQLDQLSRVGLLFRPDPVLTYEARHRLRRGAASYSLCGVTHTISSAHTLEHFANLQVEPLMEWDAIICTSSVALDVVTSTREAASDYLRWLNGEAAHARRSPQFPVIPLAVHGDDWATSPDQKATARASLEIGEEEIVILFAGRLSLAAKAHPFQMFEALQRVATCTGRRLTLVLAGQFFTKTQEMVFQECAALNAGAVRLIHIDGGDADRYGEAFRAADIFISLADSIQETFGITPLEAMASRLPVIVSDWNGYRDTVRDGIDGFRINTLSPAPGYGGDISAAYEAHKDYELYGVRCSSAVSVDMAQLVDRLTCLVSDAELRERFGQAGQAHVRSHFDWRVIYPRYRELWSELAAIRYRANADSSTRAWLASAPTSHPIYPDPFDRFASYSSEYVGPATRVRYVPGADLARYEALARQHVFSQMRMSGPALGMLFDILRQDGLSIADLAVAIRRPEASTAEIVARLLKMNLLSIVAE